MVDGHRSSHPLVCGIRSDVGVVLVAVVGRGSSCHDGRSGVVGVRNHVGDRLAVHSPYSRVNAGVVDDSHSDDHIHRSSEELAFSVAFLYDRLS